MAEMSTLNGYEIVDEAVRDALNTLGSPVSVSEGSLPMSTFMNGMYEVVDKKAREKLDELMSGGSATEPVLQEKTATENGEVVPDEGYDGLSKVVVNVPTGTSVPGGYTVNFFNADGELIQIHSTKYGYYVSAPVSYTHPWGDSSGKPYTFPLTIDADSGIEILSVYPVSGISVESAIYDHFGVDKSEYEWLILQGDKVNNTIAVYFVPAPTGPGINYSTGGRPMYSGNMRKDALVYTVYDVTIVDNLIDNVNLLLTEAAVSSTVSTLNVSTSPDENYIIGTIHILDPLPWYRLDQCYMLLEQG